ncbi:hypothetical protein ACP70R_009234 [Stipagrostis hirtigluma subsp. patula]
MPTEVIKIKLDNIDGQAEEIIGFLKSTNTGDVIYYNGFLGLGASAVLKEVVTRLRSSSSGAAAELARGLDKIIHIDSSLWANKRALQKAIAEELELPQQVLAIFEKCDEEDDFDGVELSTRGVIRQVGEMIYSELYTRRFLVVFHNGSGTYIDPWECGVPVAGFLSNGVLWTSRGRFRLIGKEEEFHDDDDDTDKLAGFSSVAIYASEQDDIEEDALYDDIRSLLHEEAEEVAKYTNVPEPDMSPKVVMECILYVALTLRDNENSMDWGTHASNYWVCDGIIQASIDSSRSAWEVGDALRKNMNLDWKKEWVEVICDVLDGEQRRPSDRWILAPHQYQQDMEEEEDHHDNAVTVQVPPQATSFFSTAPGQSIGTFKHSGKSSLRVIHLSKCTFSFSSPPFLNCSSLRFLLLDHCKDEDAAKAANDSGEEEHHQRHNNQEHGACFRKLWVLELSFTDWYWLLSEEALDLMAELRELNVKGVKNWRISHLCHNSGVKSNNCKLCNLVTLRVTSEPVDIDSSDNTNQLLPLEAFPDLSRSRILKTLVLDGCVELEELGLNVLPPSLESFSFTSKVNTKIKSISFQGCTRLERLFLNGLFRNLVDLDMSGTTVKSLDLSAIPSLRRLFLLGCEKLRTILWPPKGKEPILEVLHIDTTQAALARKGKSTTEPRDDRSAGPSSALVQGCNQTPIDLEVCIVLRDARLLRSLLNVNLGRRFYDVKISSATATNNSVAICGRKGIGQGTNSSTGRGGQQVRAVRQQKQAGNLYADGSIATLKDSQLEFLGMWPCPPNPSKAFWTHCYIGIPDETWTEWPHGTTSVEQGTRAITLPNFVPDKAAALHLHDSLSIICIPGPAPSTGVLRWNSIQWCRLERCPNLEGTVFTPPTHGEINIFWNLQTFWVSQLPKALHIWDWSASSFRPGYGSFDALVFIHLDRCPRLRHVLPLHASNVHGCRSLETLEIVSCGNLREVFPLDSDSKQQQEPREFPSLKRIHLHELPKLQRICGRRMSAPNLETIKIRGCWSLRRLPAVGRRGNKPPPEVDCEKEWWNNLEWDGERANHHPSHYKTSHSKYYKKTLLRASALR